MNTVKRPTRTLSILLIGIGSFSGVASAVVNVSDFTISGSTASITLSGSVDAGFVPGSTANDIVFVGSAEPFDNWMLTDAQLVSETNGAGATSSLVYTNTSGFAPSNFGSDWFRFQSQTSAWSGGEIIDYTANFTGSFAVGNLPTTVVVTQGYNDINQVIASGPVTGSGEVTAVPEAASTSFLVGILFLGFAALRRRSR